MKDPNLPPTHFLHDRMLSREPLLQTRELEEIEGAVRDEEAVRFSASGKLHLALRLQTRDFSRFNQFSITVMNRSLEPILVGMKLIHGSAPEGPHVQDLSFSGGREELAPGVWQDLKFPIECFGIYGTPSGWTDIREIQLIFSYERAHTGSQEIEIALRSLDGELRDIPTGPRLTSAGLTQVLNIGADEAAATPQHYSIQKRRSKRKARPFLPYTSGDSGLFIPPPHQYPQESAQEILNGRIMGQNLGHPVQWDANPLGALEWNHFLHRHHFLRALVVELSNTGNQQYAEALDRIIAGWIRDNPAPLDSNGGAGPSWETLTVAWRLREWLWIYGIAWDHKSFRRETRLTMLRSIWEHAKSLMDHKGHPNNWIIVESCALVLAGICFPGFREAGLWIETGLRRLRNEFHRQFFPDGVHFEISPLYHAICLHALIEVKAAAASKYMSLPKEFDSSMEKCAQYLIALCRPDFTWPSINDSGSVDGDYSALMRKAADVFQRPDLLWIGTKGLAGKPPDQTSHIFPDAGIASLRSSWGPDANLVIFRAGPAGAAHIHGDSLSLEVAAAGKPRLVDPGITQYSPDVLTDYYRSAAAHNMLLIDGGGPKRTGMPFSEKIMPAGRDFGFLSQDSLKAVTGLYDGPWEGSKEEFVHIRTVIFIKEEYWIVRDLVIGSGEHELTGCWQFLPGRVETDINTLTARYMDARGAGFELIPLLGKVSVEMEVSTGSLHPPRGWGSVNGSDQPATRCAYTLRTQLPVSLAWLMLPVAGQKASKVKASRHEAENGVSVEIVFPQSHKDFIHIRELDAARVPAPRTDKIEFLRMPIAEIR